MASPIVLLMHFPIFRCNISTKAGHHPCMADLALEGLLSHMITVDIPSQNQSSSVFNILSYPSQPHHLPYAISAAIWLARFPTKPSRYILLLFALNTWRERL